MSLWAGAAGAGGTGADRDDYSRTCAVEGYVGAVAVGRGRALVLGDEPAATTYLAPERLFLRWVAAPGEDDLVGAARRAVRAGLDWDADEDLHWVVDGPVVLFDAALPGTGLEPDEQLVVDLGPGVYRVRVAYHTDGDSWMILVQLLTVP